MYCRSFPIFCLRIKRPYYDVAQSPVTHQMSTLLLARKEKNKTYVTIKELSAPQSSLQMLLNVTLWENGSLVTYSALLYENLALVHVRVLAECQMDVRHSSKPWCCWQAWLSGWPGAESSSVYVLSKPFPRPLPSVMSVSYCLVAVELWELKVLSQPSIFPGQWGVRGAFMCSAGQQK